MFRQAALMSGPPLPGIKTKIPRKLLVPGVYRGNFSENVFNTGHVKVYTAEFPTQRRLYNLIHTSLILLEHDYCGKSS